MNGASNSSRLKDEEPESASEIGIGLGARSLSGDK